MDMAEAESGHRRMLLDLFQQRFGDHIPLVRREDVKGFIKRRPVWMTRAAPRGPP
jgi:rubrerythrin